MRYRFSSRLVVALAVIAVAVAACGGGGGSVQYLAFGTGGTLCDLPNVGSTFAQGEMVRMTAHFSPAPNTVTAKMAHDGVDVASASVDFAADNNCASFEFGELPIGHYRMTLTTEPTSPMPPLTGEFDVTE
jgi:hypothetical protein